ncbi:hypothetical protein KS4_32830 [Poriferisphaera corsica]|uniref:Type II secretion system protein H n=1 Tax=Poriferisphaera corsica TaxID=2528020 RepID=A0A517YY98_9BACT|nr:type II secretion system protein [Poriferisphaera corsica]QDU35203.1 hypothetical protein KS4_32830 [Poriferisphaera corsica]
MQRMNRQYRGVFAGFRPGYTLVEVLIVVTILGIAAGIVVPSMLSVGKLGVQAAARMVISDLLIAQNDAVAKQKPRTVRFNAGKEHYQLEDETNTKLTARWRGGGSDNYEVSFRDDQRFSGVDIVRADFGGESFITFDELGAPNEGGVIELKFNDDRYEVSVAAFTGKVAIKRM